ncbi:MAG: EVE domain-containing protein [Planctomycetes bacterium]|nr:EVE domain-containing protein [Planctomycetota bacterium]
MKSEPSVFSFEDLLAAPRKRTLWEGIRNHQARNFMRDDMALGDGVLFYHSSAEPSGVAGLARVSAAASADPTQFDSRSESFDPRSKREAPTWLAVEIEGLRALPQFVPLASLKAHSGLSQMLVVQRGQRLSIQPVTPREWAAVLALGGVEGR